MDKRFTVPEGFEPIYSYSYREDESGNEVEIATQLEDRIKLTLSDSRSLEFVITKGVPALPLKNYGNIKHMGWDIPTRWAVDANNQCWMDNAHGHSLCKVSSEELISEAAEDSRSVSEIRRALGLKEPIPSWVQMARHYNWNPPEGWEDEDALKSPKK